MSTDTDEIPQETLEAVVELVGTGPVLLGGYTIAEVDAVGGIRQLHEQQPDAALVAEAVRSLAARNIISTEQDSEELKIRGDLGLVTAFQHRSDLTIDARVTGSQPDHPWRFILMPQPENITLEVLIDALGIHFYSLRQRDDALARLWERLPHGERGTTDADADAVLGESPFTALVSVNRWDEAGDLRTHDVVLAQDDDRCQVFVRDPDDADRLVATGQDDREWRRMISELSTPG